MSTETLRSKLYALHWVELIVIAGIVLLYGWSTHERNFVWRDDIALWSDIIQKSPYKPRGHFNLGLELYNKGEFIKAIEKFKETKQLNPDNPVAYFNLGITYQRMGLYDPAIAEYEQFLLFKEKYLKTGFYFAEVHNNLGVCYFIKGDIKKAIKEFKTALVYNPYHSNALYNLDTLIKKGEQN